LVGGRRSRTDRSGIELLNRPRPTQGYRVNRSSKRRSCILFVVSRNICSEFLCTNIFFFACCFLVAVSFCYCVILMHFFLDKADAILHSAHKAGCAERESGIEGYLDTLDTLCTAKNLLLTQHCGFSQTDEKILCTGRK